MEILTTVIGKIAEAIAQTAAEEISLVYNFTQDFEWLQEKLISIKGHLQYADSSAVQDKRVERLLDRLRVIAWDAEDIVEECVVRPLYTDSITGHNLRLRFKLGKRIQKLKQKIDKIIANGNEQNLFRDLLPQQAEQQSSSAAVKENCHPSRDSRPVGIEPKLEKLITMIDDSAASVISVVGQGGVGKTFLLQSVLHRTRKDYKHSIWLSISQSYSVHKLQCDLASHMGDLKDTVKDVTEERAAELILARLEGTKSLIVLDDVWRYSEQDNIIKLLGLPIYHESQCKVLVTTRSMEVSEKLRAVAYKMEPLSEQDSWQLFCAHAFGGNPPPGHLQAIASEVEKQCNRLPLALKIIGASFYKIEDRRQWTFKLDQLRKTDSDEKKQVMETLRLSYDFLEPALKPCFSYLSFFPDYKLIDMEYLINLWIAEGFIPHDKQQCEGQNQWEVACGYVDQLVKLCLLEVEEDEHLVKHCKVHDLLHDLAIDISRSNRCTFAVDGAITSAKRILLGKKEKDDVVIDQRRASCHMSLRTLSLYQNPIEKIEKKFFSPVRSLRVLDLSKSKISTLPGCVGKLRLLKLLNLSCTEIKEVPICVKGLKSLLLLDLSDCKQLQSLPEWISELKCLQHLNIIDCNHQLVSLPKGISELVSLRVLRSNEVRLSGEDDGLLKLEDVAKLTCLQELSIEVKDEMQLSSPGNGALAKLLKMLHLSIKSTSSSASHLAQNPSALQYLQTLKLMKFAVTNWVCGLRNLTHLKLVACESSNFPELEAMPNLIRLFLDCNNSFTKIPKAFGKSSGFPKLRYLTIQNFSLLEELPDLEEGAMAVLEDFYVGFCPQLYKVPEGLKWLTRLAKFHYSGYKTDKLNNGAEFWNNIKAESPHVSITQSFY